MGKLICESWAQLYILSPGYQRMQQCFHVFAKKQSCGFNAIPHTRAREYI